jgi:hypothetical protein
MELKKLNQYLKNLHNLRNRPAECTEVVKEINNPNGEQGEEGLSYEVYKIEGVYIQLEISTDSYGDNERITGIQFVTPIKKEVTKFEAV